MKISDAICEIVQKDLKLYKENNSAKGIDNGRT